MIRKLRDREFLLNNTPDGVNKDDWDVTVRFTTKKNKHVSEKDILKNLNLLTVRQLNKKEKSYKDLGKDLSILDKNLLDRHLLFIKGLFDYEKKRQEHIERKALQLISQSSIIISIITLAIVILSNKFTLLDNHWFYFLVTLFSLTLCFLFLTLYFAIIALKIELFQRPAHTLISSPEARDEKTFIYTETKLLYSAVRENIDVNNKKSSQMNNGYAFFKWSILIIMVFSLLSFYTIYKSSV